MTEWQAPPAPPHRGGGAGVFALRAGKVVVALVSAGVLVLTWAGAHFLDLSTGFTTTEVLPEQAVHAKPLDGAIDILLVGQDSRTDAQGNPLPQEVLDELHAGEANGELNTDTMILVHIPQNGQHAIAISFPRDSLVDIAGGYGKHKLNSAFVYAYNDKSKELQRQHVTDQKAIDAQAKEAGRANLVKTLETFIGKPGMIDRYAEVNLASFAGITKAIDGVQVCLKNAVKEQKSGVDLPAGPQTISGVQALAFVRQRYGLPNGDLDRIARQQAFLSGLASKVLSPDVLTSPSRLSDLIDAVKQSVVLSAGWDLTEFAAQMRGLSGGNVEFHTIPTEGNAVYGGADVLRVDQAQVRAYVNSLTSDGGRPGTSTTPSTLPGANAVTVDLFDGSGSPSTATDTKKLLQDKGFKLGTDSKLSARKSTVVRYNPADQAALALLQQVLGASVEGEPDADVAAGHVRVLLGKDFHPGAASTSATPTPSKTTGTAPPASPTSSTPPITAGGLVCVN